ncbi:hypothetical protein Leryth_002727 [Lithospermum erythrorhizon]|nr:hypothetical protein Leryth_002727 [Lithospermum erythrorhizon]
MMQIGSSLPPHNLNVFQARRTTFTCNSSARPPLSSRSAKPMNNLQVKKHLLNLEKMLQKNDDQEHPDATIEKEARKGSEGNRARTLLEGLNLANFLTERKAAEEMSPRHLNKLQRLLSKSNVEYSPRNILGSKWREYHGCNDWNGMLDPLDENLRREVVRYGEFIQAAYHCFHSSPATTVADKSMEPRHVALLDRSYKVTKSLYATSSIGLPKWVDDVAPDLADDLRPS